MSEGRFAPILDNLTEGALHVAHEREKRMGHLSELAEALLSSLLVFLVTYALLGLSFGFSLVLAALAAATAPTSTIMTIRQTGARGDFVDTLLQVMALDNVVSILAFSVAISVAVAALVMAMDTTSDFFKVVMKMVSFAWAGFGAAFGPLMLLALFWRRTTLVGAVAGMITGALTCFVWKFVLAADVSLVAKYPIFGLYELAPGFLLAFAVTVAASLVSGRPAASVCETFDNVR